MLLIKYKTYHRTLSHKYKTYSYIKSFYLFHFFLFSFCEWFLTVSGLTNIFMFILYNIIFKHSKDFKSKKVIFQENFGLNYFYRVGPSHINKWLDCYILEKTCLKKSFVKSLWRVKAQLV